MKKPDLLNYLIKKSQKKLIPFSSLFELTYECTLNCDYCYIVKSPKKELSKKEIFNVLNQLAQAGCLYLSFSGGEIFTRKDFFDIASFAKRNFALILLTNGTLIDRKVADKIKKLNPFSVEMSLHGFKNTHEEITKVKGSFDKTIKAIKLLIGRDIAVYVNITLTKKNVGQIWKLVEFIEKLGANLSGIGDLCAYNDGRRVPLKYRLSEDEVRDYLRESIGRLQHLGWNLNPRRISGNRRLCGAGFSFVAITPYGEVNPCVQIKFKDNSLRKHSFAEIWREHPEFNKLRNLRISNREKCSGCDLAPYCFICPANSLLETGSLTGITEYYCLRAKIQKEVYEQIRDRKTSEEVLSSSQR